jgi:hypothetical protein
MERQMFRDGGVAFPDYSGDGKITQKDILMGRGVFPRPMQQGGEPTMPPMAPDMGMPPMAPDMGMPPGPPPVVPQGPVGDLEAAAAAGASEIDPMVMENMLADAASNFGDLDSAEDFEQVMNMMRGDQATIQDRREELAGIVGMEDAAQTPESVLTLVQPVVMIAAAEQGIGSLPAEAMGMDTPIEGAMAEGIMSTIDMGQEEPAPVNFNQGGPVIAMQTGGSPVAGRLGDIYRDKQALYQSILSPESQQQAFDEQRQMTQAQMLFDIAQGALTFATPGERTMSPAQRFAESFNPVLGSISARAGELEKFKLGQKSEQRALNLQALGAAENTLAAELQAQASAATAKQAADARAALQKEANAFAANEKALDRAHEIVLKNMEFDFKRSETMSAQDFRRELLDLQHINAVALLGLEQDNSLEAIEIKNKLQQDNMRLGSELKLAEAKVDFENVLKRDGILNNYELSRMELGHGFNVALADHNAAIAAQAQKVQNEFTAIQNVLNRASKENLQLSDQEFRARLQEEMLSNNASQADIDRAIAKTNRAFDNALALRAADRADETLTMQERAADRADEALTLQERAQTLDEMYKLGMLAVEQAAQNAIKLGSLAKTAELTYLTDADRLNKYANDQLGNETALFEQALLDYVKPSYTSGSWDGTSYTKTLQPELARQIQEALRTRVENGFEIPKIPGFNAPSIQSPTGDSSDDSAENKPPLNSTEFNQSIFNPETGVNYDSPLWGDIPRNIIKDDIRYYRATGPREVPQRISNIASEYGRELFGFPPMSEEGRELVTAEKDINNLREVINQELVNWSDDRVLKTTQDALRALAQDLTPGVFKFDESAAATLQSLKGNMGRAFAYYANMDPEYAPEAKGRFTEKQVKAALLKSRLRTLVRVLCKSEAYWRKLLHLKKTIANTLKTSLPVGLKAPLMV